MRASRKRKLQTAAPVSRGRKARLVRRHWLTGAFVLILVGGVVGVSARIVSTELELRQAQKTRKQLQAQVEEERAKNQLLQSKVSSVTDDQYMELVAKAMGYVYPEESVYQEGAPRSH